MKTYESIGIFVNITNIAKGLYQMIKESPNGACITLGMFPAELMEALNKQLKSRIPDSFYSQTAGEVIDYGKEIRQEIEHEVCCKILELAQKKTFY